MNTSSSELSVIETFVTPSSLSTPCIYMKISEILKVTGILKITDPPKTRLKVEPGKRYFTKSAILLIPNLI